MTKLLWIFAGVSVFTAAQAAADYTGFWKVRCSDEFGVQIRHVDAQHYSVSFCGPGGCFKPGEWTPNTGIEGDANYTVISPDAIRIGKLDYLKCSADPAWQVTAQPERAQAEKKPLDCPLTGVDGEGVLIAWVKGVRETTQWRGTAGETTAVGAFRPVALLDGTSLRETSGSGIRAGQSFWRVLSASSPPVKLAAAHSFVDHMGEDHCVYYGTLDHPELPEWTLLSSKPLHGLFRKPSAKEEETFYRLNTACVKQGDYPEGKEPPCVRPQLLAVSDFNKNGKIEFWATEPYLWDTGLTVWELGDKLEKIFSVCAGCSD